MCDSVRSYSISLCQTPFWNVSLAARTKQWTVRNLYKNRVHTGTRCLLLHPSTRSRPGTRVPARCPNSSVGTWEKGVFTLVSCEKRTRAPCPDTECERCLRRQSPYCCWFKVQFSENIFLCAVIWFSKFSFFFFSIRETTTAWKFKGNYRTNTLHCNNVGETKIWKRFPDSKLLCRAQKSRLQKLYQSSSLALFTD